MIVSLVYPHQLYKEHPAIRPGRTVYLLEDHLYFLQYIFHKHKLILHRASMKFYEQYLKEQGVDVKYIPFASPLAQLENMFNHWQEIGVNEIHYADTTDYLLERRMQRYSKRNSIGLVRHHTPNFMFSIHEVNAYFDARNRYFMADFYEAQRKRTGIMMNGVQPVGGRFSFDKENRKKLPRGLQLPQLPCYKNEFIQEARSYIDSGFSANPGESGMFNYPVTFDEAETALSDFLERRFHLFGPYQDAMIKSESFLFHSILSSSLNTGLLDPKTVVDKSITYAFRHGVPVNSLEGFIRQIMGWREYMRALYLREGVKQRLCNYNNFTRKIPTSFRNGTTGIDPVDSVITRVLRTGYAHHIERLMVMGNFMLLCEFDPNEVYRWFMELFIDAYDWVMVPNVYGMSQFASGGLMSTKPYISGSNYILKMSNYRKGPWTEIWDSLFWRFMHVYRELFEHNPRLSMLLRTFDTMPAGKRKHLLERADSFLERLDKDHGTIR